MSVINSLFGDIFSTVPIIKLSRYEFGGNSDLNYLVWGYLRIQLKQQISKIPQDITLLCSEYAGSFINSHILFGNLNVHLISLLEKRNIQCGLSRKIYNAQTDGFDSKSFYEMFKKHYESNHHYNNANKKTNVGSVLIVQSSRGFIFGGYTKTKWTLNGSSYDETAFLFSLFRPKKKNYDKYNEDNYTKNVFSFQAQQEFESQINAKIFGISPSAASEMFAVCRPKNYDTDYVFFWGSPNSLYVEQNGHKSQKNFIENGGYSIPDFMRRNYFKVQNFEIFELA